MDVLSLGFARTLKHLVCDLQEKRVEEASANSCDQSVAPVTVFSLLGLQRLSADEMLVVLRAQVRMRYFSSRPPLRQ